MSDAFDYTQMPSSPPEFSLPSLKRARELYLYREESNYNPSSDSPPPLFSSDPPDPSIDNYAQRSRKRQYRGTWWRQQHATRAAFTRNLDSGVWMGSDDDSVESQYAASNEVLPNSRRSTTRSAPATIRSAAETEAYRIVHESVERDAESVDISGLELGRIPLDLLSPLRLVTKQASFLKYDESPKDEDFEPLRPSLKLFLQKNALRKLPADLWNLEYLTVLSLRQNKLTYVPAAIGRLRHLRELNLACNRLRYLPWELLRLITGEGGQVRNGALRNLTVSPNPFFRAVYRDRGSQSGTGYGSINVRKERNLDFVRQFEEEMRSATSPESSRDAAWSAKMHHYYYEIRQLTDDGPPEQTFSWDTVQPLYMSSTPVVFLNIDGSSADSSAASLPSTIPHIDNPLLCTIPLGEDFRPTPRFRGSFVPSLFELATSVIKNVSNPSDLRTLLPEDTPQPVFRALDLASVVKEEEGERICSVCARRYVIPRTEWIEFWHRIPVNAMNPEMLTDIGMDELFLPFLRRGCSWRCVPPTHEGTSPG